MPHKDPEAKKTWRTKHYAANKERINKTRADYYASNPAARARRDAANRRLYERDHDKRLADERERRRQMTPLIKAARHAIRRRDRKERRDARETRHCDHCGGPFKPRQDNQHFCCVKCNMRHSQKVALANRRVACGDKKVTAADVAMLMDYCAYRCAYCGSQDRLAIDHVIPLAHGGENDVFKLVVACKRCNSSKRAHSLLEFMFLEKFGWKRPPTNPYATNQWNKVRRQSAKCQDPGSLPP